MAEKKPVKEKGKAGRPSLYSVEVAAAICERLSNGESLRKICLDDKMPGRQTVLAWLDDDTKAEFRTKYARAREAQADFLADEIVEIANTPEIGTKSTTKEWGTEIAEGDMIEHRRLKVLARQWYAAKLNPKKYGDKMQLDATITDNTPMADKMKAARDRAKGKK